MCRLFNDNRIWERAEAGELEYRVDSKQKTAPRADDHRGVVATHTELLTVWEKGDPRREVASEVNRHVASDGTVGGSGKWDPAKGDLHISGKLYRKFKMNGGRVPYCELCENGDMIPESERQYDSMYRPKVRE